MILSLHNVRFMIMALLETIKAHRERPVQEIEGGLIAEIRKFVGEAPRFDDITLMIIQGEKDDKQKI